MWPGQQQAGRPAGCRLRWLLSPATPPCVCSSSPACLCHLCRPPPPCCSLKMSYEFFMNHSRNSKVGRQGGCRAGEPLLPLRCAACMDRHCYPAWLVCSAVKLGRCCPARHPALLIRRLAPVLLCPPPARPSPRRTWTFRRRCCCGRAWARRPTCPSVSWQLGCGGREDEGGMRVWQP